MLNDFRAKGILNPTFQYHIKSSDIFDLRDIEKKKRKIAYAGISILHFLSNRNIKYTVS